jgi:hypothetical protein
MVTPCLLRLSPERVGAPELRQRSSTCFVATAGQLLRAAGARTTQVSRGGRSRRRQRRSAAARSSRSISTIPHAPVQVLRAAEEAIGPLTALIVVHTESRPGGVLFWRSSREHRPLTLVVASLDTAHPRSTPQTRTHEQPSAAAVAVTITTAWSMRWWRCRPGRQNLISCRPPTTSAAPTAGQSPPFRRRPGGACDRRAQCAMRRRRPCSAPKPGGPKRRLDPRGGRRAPSRRRSARQGRRRSASGGGAPRP